MTIKIKMERCIISCLDQARTFEAQWYQGLMGTIHKGDHATYEQNLPDSDLGLDSVLSIGMYESQ